MNHDNHIHTPFCPHGSEDAIINYIERALKLGLTNISFTEHAPLPKGFIDTVPGKDSAMTYESLASYLASCLEVKKHYSDRININIGLEVDYIEGFEKETTDFLNEWGPHLDDSILSVHFLQYVQGKYICLDYGVTTFEELVTKCGSLKNVYQLYYDTLLKSISYSLGQYTPKRVGHISLVRKFQQLFPRTFDDSSFLEETIQTMVRHNKTLDVNAAGLFKEHCQEVYPPISWIKRAKQLNVPLVYGSDAHAAHQVGQARDSLINLF
nr:histidinol-phosphatase HisJ [Salipaludibacillus daqingensis]